MARPCLEALEERLPPAAGILVNSAADTNLRDDVLTLREAILVSNHQLAVAGLTAAEKAQVIDTPTQGKLDFIHFNIPGLGVRTIRVTDELPVITDPVIIDGTTQAGYQPGLPVIELDGSEAGTADFLDGLDIRVGGNLIMGLIIHSFAGHGIRVDGHEDPQHAGGNIIVGNFIGTDALGLNARGNQYGIYIADSPNNVIGGLTLVERNVISGNLLHGIVVSNQVSTNNTVIGNFIGTDATGMNPLPNQRNGILLSQSVLPFQGEGYASGNIIGGSEPGSRNVISGNNWAGISILGGSDNTVLGNYIGLGDDRTTPIPNIDEGVLLMKVKDSKGIHQNTDNQIGGVDVGAGNYIAGNNGYGVRIVGSRGNTVLGNFIGLQFGGTTPAPNILGGVKIEGGALCLDDQGQVIPCSPDEDLTGGEEIPGNVIGGSETGARNFISGNGGHGVSIIGSHGHTVLGNSIGLGIDGRTPAPNHGDGVFIEDADFNVIGGVEDGHGNVISANQGHGVSVVARDHGARENYIQGNLIGTTSQGQFSGVGNHQNGVDIRNESSNESNVQLLFNQVGGSDADDGAEDFLIKAGNLISGNGGNGVRIAGHRVVNTAVLGNYIGTDATGMNLASNFGSGIEVNSLAGQTEGPSLTRIGEPGASNIISGNFGAGISLNFATTSTIILANRIGVGLNDHRVLPNDHGIVVTNSSNNVIGRRGEGNGNLISANKNAGVVIRQVQGIGTASDNTLTNNFIGTDLTGELTDPDNTPGNGDELGNRGNGVMIENAAGNTVELNVIGGSLAGAAGSGAGVYIAGFGATDNKVYENHIGVSRAGVRLSNSAGVLITPLPDNSGGPFENWIGGTSDVSGVEVSLGNVISFNEEDGVLIAFGSKFNHVVGNEIGTALDGHAIMGNEGNGIAIFDASGNIIGGKTEASRNFIAGNAGNGILISGPEATDNQVQGNTIGTAETTFHYLGNKKHGVLIANGASNNRIGGILEGEGNVIASNGIPLSWKGHGVVVESGMGNAIQGNRIFFNAGRGIDLVNPTTPDTFTLNDFGDSDVGANGLQDYPVAIDVVSVGSDRRITWALNSTPNSTFSIDFFATDEPDPSGFGEGKFYLGTMIVFTDDTGEATPFSRQFSASERYISTTATLKVDHDGDPSTPTVPRDTSEFSMVDSDADALADAWETRGIDLDEDGTVDFKPLDADPLQKDLYVEVDWMTGVVPGRQVLQQDLNMVALAFFGAPVLNPNGLTGINLHPNVDEEIPRQAWTGNFNGTGLDALGEDRDADGNSDVNEDLDGDGKRGPGEPDVDGDGRLDRAVEDVAGDGLGPGDPDDQEGWPFFHKVKEGKAGAGGFGTEVERASKVTLQAKRLVYRYAIFADRFGAPRLDKDGNLLPGATVGTSGIAEIGGNDLMVTLGAWTNVTPEVRQATFMHELGHTLGLLHGGDDDVNFKPNYHSVMNYVWTMPRDWMREDPNYSGDQDFTDLDGDGAKGPLEPYVEFNLIGPSWDPHDTLWKLDYSTGASGSYNDWANLHFPMLESEFFASGTSPEDQQEELTLELAEELASIGPGPGVLKFSASNYEFNETDGVVTITVLRSAGTQGTVTVSFAAVAGTAQEGEDYEGTSGVLTFAEGEYRKTFTVHILDDLLEEPTESLTLTLSNPTGGATLFVDNTVTLTILDDPVADDDGPFVVTEGGTLNVPSPGVLDGDLDADSPTLAAILVSAPAHGSLTLNADGSFTYVHDGSETTGDSFTYKVNDGETDSNVATVSITITPANDAPVADGHAYRLAAGGRLSPAAPGVLAGDSDAEGTPLTAILVTGPAHGSLTLNADGSFTYIHDGSATSSDSFTYQASDGDAGSSPTTVSFTILSTGQAELVKDINQNTLGNSLSLSQVIVDVNGTAFFLANDGIHGWALWKSDGTAACTVLVKDNFLAPGSGGPNFLTPVGDTLFFTAHDGVRANALWKSDGTAAGTVVVKDGVTASGLAAVGDTLYFKSDDGVHGLELWTSDGTAAGTVLFKDIVPGSGSGNPGAIFDVGSAFFFVANDGIHGTELWTSDGTAEGTTLAKDIKPGGGASGPFDFTNVNGTLFFTANDGINGKELWKSDGTAEGTMLVKDFVPGSGSSILEDFTPLNGTLFFTVRGAVSGEALWKSDGTAAGTVLVKSFTTNSDPASFHMTAVGGAVFFQADNGSGSAGLWKSDGTAAGTVLVKAGIFGFHGCNRSLPRNYAVFLSVWLPAPVVLAGFTIVGMGRERK